MAKQIIFSQKAREKAESNISTLGIIKEAIDEAIRLDRAKYHYIKCEECKCLLNSEDAIIVKVLEEDEGDKYYCKRCKPNYDIIHKDGTTHKNKL